MSEHESGFYIMSRRRFFVEEVRRGEAELSGEEAEHLTRVLRAEVGQRFEICDGARLYLGEIVEARKRAVRFRIVEALEAREPAVRIALLAALTRFERFEWMIEKATELGVARIAPVCAERSEKGLQLAARKRVERWSKIARAAAQQSRRVTAPEIGAPIGMREALAETADRRLYLDEQAGCPMLRDIVKEPRARESVALFIGPEGGWTDRERAGFTAAGWTAVSFGPLILRAETAAIAGVAWLAHTWEPGCYHGNG